MMISSNIRTGDVLRRTFGDVGARGFDRRQWKA
jgi:hypothetical protein